MFKSIKKFLFLNVLPLTFLSSFAALNLEDEYYKMRIETEERIRVLDHKIERVNDKANWLTDRARERMRNQYNNFVLMRNNLEKKLADARNATEDNWEITKSRIEYYTDILERSIDKVID